jgi:hypothetical protein
MAEILRNPKIIVKIIVDESPSRQTKCAEHAFVSFRPGHATAGLCERPGEAGCMASVSACDLSCHRVSMLIYWWLPMFKLGNVWTC